MKPKYKPKYLEAEHGGQRERWLISYTDLITILLILFAAVAAQGLHSSENSPPHLAPAQKALPTHPASAAPAVSSPPQQSTLPQLTAKPAPQDPALVQAEEKLRALGLDSRLEKRGLVISLPQAVLFPSGEDRVMPAAFPMVSDIAGVLGSVPNKVALVGHADSVPIHNKRFHNNWELSAARSVKLLELLTTRYGIDESRFSVQSDGVNEPRDSNETPAGRAENRRVDILLLDQSAQ
jgi:chemotaxis protein MotB